MNVFHRYTLIYKKKMIKPYKVIKRIKWHNLFVLFVVIVGVFLPIFYGRKFYDFPTQYNLFTIVITLITFKTDSMRRE